MTDQEKRRLIVAFAIAKADNDQIDESDMGMYFWGKYADHYLGLADEALTAHCSEIDDELAQVLAKEASRGKRT